MSEGVLMTYKCHWPKATLFPRNGEPVTVLREWTDERGIDRAIIRFDSDGQEALVPADQVREGT